MNTEQEIVCAVQWRIQDFDLEGYYYFSALVLSSPFYLCCNHIAKTSYKCTIIRKTDIHPNTL